MGYQLKGTYVTHCDCTQICPCAVDEAPTGRDGQCHGVIVANIAQGSLDGTDLSGTKVALGYFSPGKISDGHLRLGLVIDEAASDDQAAALERIFSGQEGGMFGEFAALSEDGWVSSVGRSPSPTEKSLRPRLAIPRSASQPSVARTET